MIRTYLTFDLKEGQADALVGIFQEGLILETAAAQPGCRSTELTISQDGRQAIATAVWDDLAAYEVWTSRSDRAGHTDKINPLLSRPIGPDTVGGQFTVALSVESNDDKSERGGSEL